MKNFKNYIIGVLIVSGGLFALAQGLGSQAFFLNGSTGSVVQFSGYNQGAPILGPAVGQTVLNGSLVTTAAASNAVTITGVTTTSNCVIAATNAAGAANIATTYISAVAANTVTVTHIATAALDYNIHCTPK